MSSPVQFTHHDLEIVNEELLSNQYFTLKKIHFRHKLFSGGMSDIITRELLIKGQASAVVAYDPKEDKVILVEQVRIGAYLPETGKSPWLLELIAGMVEEGEIPEEVAVRESEEEAGVKITNITHAISTWDSPGGQLERIHIFAAQVDSNTASGIHGLPSEGEDIKVHVVSRQQAYDWVNDGTIDNCIAVQGLLWLQLNYQRLQKQWTD